MQFLEDKVEGDDVAFVFHHKGARLAFPGEFGLAFERHPALFAHAHHLDRHRQNSRKLSTPQHHNPSTQSDHQSLFFSKPSSTSSTGTLTKSRSRRNA